jgi:hypothetical protein
MRSNAYGFIVNDSLDGSMGFIVNDSLGEMIPARLANDSMGSMGGWDDFLNDVQDFVSNPSDSIEDLYKSSSIYQSLSSAEKGIIDVMGVENYNKVISKIQETPIGQAINSPSQAMASYVSSKSGVPEGDIMNGSAVIVKNADGSITVQRTDGTTINAASSKNTAMYIALGGGAILLAGLIVFMMKRGKGKKGKRK